MMKTYHILAGPQWVQKTRLSLHKDTKILILWPSRYALYAFQVSILVIVWFICPLYPRLPWSASLEWSRNSLVCMDYFMGYWLSEVPSEHFFRRFWWKDIQEGTRFKT